MHAAGSGEIVEYALRDLSEKGEDATDIRSVLRRILEIREKLAEESRAATAQ